MKTIFLCRYLHSEALRREIHEGLNVVENWNSANSFIINGERYSNSGMIEDWGDGAIDGKRVRLNQIVAPRSRFVYQYDFGDSWEHEIKVEKVVALQAGIKIPRCVAGERACPPEDCGGAWGYGDMLEKLAGAPCEERSELIEWLGYEFDPQHFNLHEINKNLKHLQK